MLNSVVVVGLSKGPVGKVEGLTQVVPHPGLIVEDVCQTDPESKVSVAIPASSSDIVPDGVLLLLRIDLNQMLHGFSWV